MDLKGKAAVVTGSSSDGGVGAECAKILASRGCNVVVNYAANADGGDAIAAECAGAGVESIAVQGDVAKDDDCRRLVEAAVGRWGAKSPRKAIRSCGKHAVSTTIIVAPITVPIIRNQPLRSEAPSCGRQTIAAEEPAQNGLSSSSQNATKRARHTEAHNRTLKSSGSPAAVSASVKLLPNRGDAALVCIQPYSGSSFDGIVLTATQRTRAAASSAACPQFDASASAAIGGSIKSAITTITISCMSVVRYL